MIPVSYLQYDGRWGGNDYSAPGEKTTIAKAGCGPSCVAMIIASLADTSVTPAEACAWSLAHGYKALKQGTYYSYINAHLSKYGIKSTQVNRSSLYKSTSQTAKNAHTKALDAIKNGNWVIACMGPGTWTSSGHFVLWYGVNGKYALIHDPASLKNNRIRGDLATFQREVKYYWVIDLSAFKQEDEVVEKRKIKILGKEYTADGIFKEGLNYITPKVMADAGFEVSSEGSKPVISLSTVKVSVDGEEKEIAGISSNGTTYAGIRELAEMLGCTVDWANGTVIINNQ